jgi:hypothetical protein
MPPDPALEPNLEDPDSGFRPSQLLGTKSWIPLALIFAYGCYARLSGFDAHWINPDEGIYYSMATWENWGQFYAEFSANAHPPLYYVLLKLLAAISPEVWVLRSIALVFGCCCIPATFLFARECVGRNRMATLTGLFAAFLVAISYTAIEMSQLIRPYTMQIACLTFALYYLVRFLRVGGRRTLALYATLMIGALLMHYGTMLAFAGVGLALVVLAVCRQLAAEKVRPLVIWNLPVLTVTVAEYLWHIQPKLEGSKLVNDSLQGWLNPFMIHGASDVVPRLLGMLSSAFLYTYEGPVAIALVAGLAVAFARRNFHVALFTTSILAVAIVASAAQKYPLGCSRHSLYLAGIVAPPIAFAIAWGIARGLRTAIVTVAVVAALLVFRDQVSNALGSPDLYRDPENPLLRSHYAKAKKVFVRNTPGFTLMSVQTYYQFMPEYHRERQSARRSGDGAFRLFRWGQRDMLVYSGWEFNVDVDDAGKPFRHHLHEVIMRIDREMPDLHFGEQTSVMLFVGSWSRLDRKLDLLGDAAGRTTNVPGFRAVELNVARYKTNMAKAKKRGR